MLRRIAFDSAWSLIQEEAKALLIDPEENSAEDLLAAMRTGEVTCLQNEDGIWLTTVKINPKTRRLEYHVRWGSRVEDETGCFERVLPELEKAAKATHCRNIVFDSSRLGWIRKAPKAGFRLRNAEFVRAVK